MSIFYSHWYIILRTPDPILEYCIGLFSFPSEHNFENLITNHTNDLPSEILIDHERV
jgi:hypothetical protein